MKICIVAPHFHPETGGMETNILEISKSLIKKGYDIEVHTSSRTTVGKRLPERDVVDGIRIYRYKPIVSLGYYATLIKPRLGSFDILHLHAYGYYPHLRLISEYAGKPIVFTPHHGPMMPRKGRLLDAMFHTMYGSAFKKRLKHISKIILVSGYGMEWYTDRGYPADKITIIPNGVGDDAFYRTNAPELFQRFNLIGEKYILYVGRLHPEKSVHHLIEAFSKISARYPDFKLVIAGPDSGELNKLSHLCRQLGVSGSVVFTGLVSDEEKRALLGSCTVFVLPSRFEAQGIVILEAMAQGRAVVASNVGGVPFMIKEGTTGMLYEYGDVDALSSRISQLIDDPELRLRLGNNAVKIVSQEFTWKTIVDKTENVYREVMENHK